MSNEKIYKIRISKVGTQIMIYMFISESIITMIVLLYVDFELLSILDFDHVNIIDNMTDGFKKN